MRKVHEAKRAGAAEIEIWGTGAPRREFLHVDDLRRRAGVPDEALFGRFARQRRHRARHHDPRAGGTPRESRRLGGPVRLRPHQARRHAAEVMDVSRLTRLGWTAKVPIEEGFRGAYEWYVRHVAERSEAAPARG